MALIERQDVGTCAVLTLNRPEVLNAISDALLDELDAHLDRLETDASRAWVLTGQGRAFCAGSDLSGAHNAPDARIHRMHRLVQRLQTFPKVSVAALNGLTLGGGLEIALACTFRVAVAHAKLGLPEIKLGVIPLYGGTLLLPRLIGDSRALELMLSGDPVDGHRALDWGLVNRVCATNEELLPLACGLAESVSRHSLVPQQALRRLMRELPGLSVADGLALEWQVGQGVAVSADAQEGIRAFLEKRPPVFQDR